MSHLMDYRRSQIGYGLHILQIGHPWVTYKLHVGYVLVTLSSITFLNFSKPTHL